MPSLDWKPSEQHKHISCHFHPIWGFSPQVGQAEPSTPLPKQHRQNLRFIFCLQWNKKCHQKASQGPAPLHGEHLEGAPAAPFLAGHAAVCSTRGQIQHPLITTHMAGLVFLPAAKITTTTTTREQCHCSQAGNESDSCTIFSLPLSGAD